MEWSTNQFVLPFEAFVFYSFLFILNNLDLHSLWETTPDPFPTQTWSTHSAGRSTTRTCAVSCGRAYFRNGATKSQSGSFSLRRPLPLLLGNRHVAASRNEPETGSWRKASRRDWAEHRCGLSLSLGQTYRRAQLRYRLAERVG